LKAIEQDVHVVMHGSSNLEIYADEIVVYDHSSENYWPVLSYGTVYYAVQGGSNFEVCGCARLF